MDKSETIVETIQGIADIFSKNDVSIVLFIFSIFFFLLANVEKMPFISLNNNSKIKIANYLMGGVLLAISIIMSANKSKLIEPISSVPIATQSQTISPTPIISPTPTISPTPIISPSPSISPSPIGSPTLKINSTQENIVSSDNKPKTISKPEAIKLIDSYLDAKRRIFSRVYSKAEAKKYLTGNLYTQVVECSTCDTSIDWLRRNNAYYIFGQHTIGKVEDIRLVSSEPTIKMQISEGFGYYENTIKKSNVQYCGYFTYTLQLDEGVWKISDYSKDSSC